MLSDYPIEFFKWFVHRFKEESYRKMGVDHLAGLVENPLNDLVMVINRKRNVLEVESNYFSDGRAEFSLIEIGIRYERYLRGY